MPVAEPFASDADLDAYRERADRFVAEMLEEYYLHFAGLKDELELEAIYERHADLTTLDAAVGLGQRVNGDRGVRELWQFACGGYLGNLIKSQEARASELEATLDGDRRRADAPLPDAAPGDRERARPGEAAARSRRRAASSARSTSTRSTSRRLDDPARGDARARLAGLRRALPPLRLQARRARRAVPRGCSTRPSGCTRTHCDRLFRERVGVSLAEAERWDVSAALPRAGVGRGLPGRAACCPPSRRRSPSSGIDLDAQANVELDVEQREKKSPRAFCAPIEVPGRVDARDPADRRRRRLARALPRGRPHRALREHLRRPADGGEAARRQRRHRGLGVAVRAPRQRAGVARRAGSTSRARESSRPRARRSSSSSSAATARSCSTSSSFPGRRPGADAGALRRAARRRAQDRAEPDRLPRRHRPGLLRDRVPALLGVRGAAARTTCGALRQRVVRRAARPARCCASCGRSARARPRTSCSTDVTGAEIDMAAVAERVRERLR